MRFRTCDFVVSSHVSVKISAVLYVPFISIIVYSFYHYSLKKKTLSDTKSNLIIF